MSTPENDAPSTTVTSVSGPWLAFTLSGALAVGAIYWLSPNRHPHPGLKQPFVLTQANLARLPTALQNKILTLQQEINAGQNLIENITRLGRVAHASGLPQIAQTCWEQLRSFEPANARWPYLLADLARDQRDDPTERLLLLESLKRDATYPPTYLHLGNLYFRTGDLEAASTAFRNRLVLDPEDPHARLGLARIAQREGHAVKRLTLLQETVTVAPDFPSAHNLLAAELTAQGDMDGARRHRWLGHSAGRWTQAPDPWLDELEDDCWTPDRLYVLATRDFQLNRTDQVLKWVQRVSELKPDDFENLEFLGDFYLRLGRLEQAEAAMAKALSLERSQPPGITIFSNLAETYRQAGNPPLALKVTEQGLILHPDAVELHNSLGVCRSELGDKQGAIDAFRTAVKTQPFDPDANFNLGYTLVDQGAEKEGIDAISRSLVQSPTSGKALTFLGQYHLASGDMEAARGYLERLYDAYWGIPDVRRLWADWHFKAGALASATDEAEAESLYRAGLKIDDSLSDLHLGLGALLVSQKRIPEAIASLQRVQQLTPDDSRGFLYMGHALLLEGQTAQARQQLQVGLEFATMAGQTATAARCRELLRGL